MMGNLDDDQIDDVARYFGALSVGMRLKILNALRGGERTVGELTEAAGCTQANASKHLAVLAASGMVAKTPRGTSAYYRIADPRIYRLCDLVCGQIGRRYREDSRRKRAFVRAARG
jgi:DNA-binding transcriptional ArsR family regulator